MDEGRDTSGKVDYRFEEFSLRARRSPSPSPDAGSRILETLGLIKCKTLLSPPHSLPSHYSKTMLNRHNALLPCNPSPSPSKLNGWKLELTGLPLNNPIPSLLEKRRRGGDLFPFFSSERKKKGRKRNLPPCLPPYSKYPDNPGGVILSFRPIRRGARTGTGRGKAKRGKFAAIV